MLKNCEVQSVSAGASISVRVAVGKCTSSGVSLFMPRVLFASSLCFGVMGAVVDCEVKGVNIGAGRTCLCVVVDVYSSFSIRVSVPSVLLTGRDFK